MLQRPVAKPFKLKDFCCHLVGNLWSLHDDTLFHKVWDSTEKESKTSFQLSLSIN